jgi:hypothetical protein
MSNWITPIMDRTEADVARIKYLNSKRYENMTADEKAEWAQDSKGALNRSDLERIENNMVVISEMIGLNWQLTPVPTLPTVNYFNGLRERANILYTRCAASMYSEYIVPEAPLNTHTKLNSLEHVLFDIYNMVLINLGPNATYYVTGESDDPELYISDDVLA